MNMIQDRCKTFCHDKKAHPSLIKLDQYKKAQELWNTLKEDDEKLNTEIMRLKS